MASENSNDQEPFTTFSKSWKSDAGKNEKRRLMSTAMKGLVAQHRPPFCSDVSKYVELLKIGQGTFGEVFKAREKSGGRLVALKKILTADGKEGFPITSLREIRILKSVKHDNIINLIEICKTQPTQANNYCSTFYLVMDFCEHDLCGLLSNANVKFNLAEIKKIMQQLLNALYHLHANKILHRDLKTSNVLITKQGVLKLADFGLSRAISGPRDSATNRYTNRVVTLWYRPPELLLGDRNYGPPIDMWGAGCIMAELWTRSPILQGKGERHQLELIMKLCGSITPGVWPDVERLKLYKSMVLPKTHQRQVKKLMDYMNNKSAFDLLDQLLTLDPKQRIDADNALNHDFFWEDPDPIDLAGMLSHHKQSMFQYTMQQKAAMRSKYLNDKPNGELPQNGYVERVY